MAKRTFFSGDTLAQALLDAARYHGVEPEHVNYEAVDKKHGFVKRARRVVIRVDPEAPSRALPAAAAVAVLEQPRRAENALDASTDAPSAGGPAPSEEPLGYPLAAPSAPLAAVVVSEQAARRALGALLALAKLELEVEFKNQDAEGLVVELAGSDAALVLEDQGRVLEALQHLLPRLLRGDAGEYVPCRIDCRGFRERREEALKQLALRALGEVRRKRRPQILKPLSPADRRIVHMTLAEVQDVETESEGDGFFKRVVVRLAAAE